MSKIELYYRFYFENDFAIVEVIIKPSNKSIFLQLESNFKIFHKIDEKIINFIKENIKNYENILKMEMSKNYNENTIIQKIYFPKLVETFNEEIKFKVYKEIIEYKILENLCSHCLLKKECFEKKQKQFSRQRCKNFIEK